MDLLELPLKQPSETFMDDPLEINDVNIHDLVLDIEDNTKNINRLHNLQAVAIFLYTLEDIMKLYKNTELLKQFREQHLAKRNIDVHLLALSNDLNRDTNSNNGTNIYDTEASQNLTLSHSPPTETLKLGANVNDLVKETTGDPLILDDGLITIEQLIATTDINKSCEIDFDDMSKDFQYYQIPKIKQQNKHVIKVFDLVEIPNLTIEDFLIRIRTYSSSISVLCYIHACLLIFKLSVLLDVLPLNCYNVHRVILAAIRCLIKKLEDIYQKQKNFATVGGVTIKELFRIEVGFLFLCNFNLIVGERSLDRYLKDFASLRNFVRHNIDNI